MALILSPLVKSKLALKHSVQEHELTECFANIEGGFLMDDREDHQTTPPTQWFISETDYGRKLKICFVMRGKDVYIKTAYCPNKEEIDIYNRHAK